MNSWRKLSQYTQGLVLIMVSILFFTWGIFGANQVQNQTATILEGVQLQLQEAEADRLTLERTLESNSNFQVCVWKDVIRAQIRTQKPRAVIHAIDRCERRYLT